MDYRWLLFGFDGRINRANVWLAGLIVMCWTLFLGLVVLVVAKLSGIPGAMSFGFNAADIFRLTDPVAIHQAIDNLRKADTATLLSLLFRVAVTPIIVWICAAASIKRLHDRDKSGWWLIPFIIVPGLFQQFEDQLGDSAAVTVLRLLVDGLGIWGSIELLFLRGTQKTNRFGLDPLLAIDKRQFA